MYNNPTEKERLPEPLRRAVSGNGPADWVRLKAAGRPVYVRPDKPDWLVPDPAGDRLLAAMTGADGPTAEPGAECNDRPDAAGDVTAALDRRQLLSLLDSPDTEVYRGRAEALSLNGLNECWLHITDRCNLACRHCLFSCSRQTRTTLPGREIAAVVDGACRLGARVFYLTGGEPLVHPEFQSICRRILTARSDTFLVILTNGILLPDQAGFLQSLPDDRLFLQVSLDGDEPAHDRLRGRGSFSKTLAGLGSLGKLTGQTTLSMAVQADNCRHMTDLVRLAADHGVPAVHYLWLFVSGRATTDGFVPPETLFDQLIRAWTLADDRGLQIDNISNMAGRVFSTPGTKHDLGNAGWESLAVGPDGRIYPTPALIGREEIACGHISRDLEAVWRNSPVMENLRRLSLIQNDNYAANPLKFIIGGGDIDHSYSGGGDFVGHDPYLPLYNRLALRLMAATAPTRSEGSRPGILARMGERLEHCHHNGHGVALTHSNCVLALAEPRGVVGEFYSQAAETPNPEILNPVCYPEEELDHIPTAARTRSYGCGSPVLDAGLRPGERVVDLGSGTGVECFIAARKVGPEGMVIGIDMLDNMLARAEDTLKKVADRIGYRNVAFKKGLLEQLPVDTAAADVVISNCVINLSQDKRQTFAEIFRVLRPGGRLFISDVVTDRPCPPAIQNDAGLRGECLAGALTQAHLMAILETAGFRRIRIVRRFFYRMVRDHRFYSITYTALRPEEERSVRLLYPGPFAAVITDSGELLPRGEAVEIAWPFETAGDETIFTLDRSGSVSNLDQINTCACASPSPAGSESKKARSSYDQPLTGNTVLSGAILSRSTVTRHPFDCMLCSRPLNYLRQDRMEDCVFCGRRLPANAVCDQGHFVCDGCHQADLTAATGQICTQTRAVDTIDLINRLRTHPAFPVHGPEHHFAVPGVICAVYRNRGGDLTDADILNAIDRGRAVPGGICAFWGACGAAVGVGIAFGVILNSTPLTPGPRKIVQQVTEAVSRRLSRTEAARCCQREVWTALKAAAELSVKFLPLTLPAVGDIRCRQQARNRECLRQGCPYGELERG